MKSFEDWLREAGLERYAPAFAENDIDFHNARTLSEVDLKELGLTLGHRKDFLTALAALESPANGPVTAPLDASVGASANASTGERRQLTVMFCDLVGSTALSEKLDPEELRALLHDYRTRCGEVISRYEGFVARYVGDGILTYFGWPKAHEEDAERALRAALEIVQTVKSASSAEPLSVRIGIATGPVVVGEQAGVGEQSKLAIGSTPNLAARLQDLASADQVVIASSTRRLIGNAFELADLGEHELKGIAEPVHAWRVMSVSAAASRFEAARGEAGLTPLVGREQEVGLLLDRWRQAQEGEGQVVLLSGEPGIGKSRVLSALRERLEDQGVGTLRFQCSPYYINSAFYPSIDNFERALKFGRDETPESKLDKLEALIVKHYGRPIAEVRFIASLLSIPYEERYGALPMTPQRFKDETLRTLVDLTEAAARKQPTVMLYEDAHWADPTSLEALDLLVDRVRAIPLLIVLTHRPEFQSRWSQHGHVTALNLSKLTRAQSGAIVSKLAGGKALPAELLEQILAKTDGVPLYVEELTKTILESGELKDVGDRYDYTGATRTVTIPATLRDSLTARLDRSAAAKEIAQIGAAIGREFSYELIQAVAPMDPPRLDSALAQLTDSGLAFRRGTPPDAVYTFKHALVQDAAYDSLLKSRRQELHTKIARAIEQRFPDIANTEPELIGYHYAQANQHDSAVRYYEAGGNRALGATALAEAINHFSQALDQLGHCPDTDARDRVDARIRIALGGAFLAHKGWAAPEIQQTLERAYELAHGLDDELMMIASQWLMASPAQAVGDLVRAHAIARNLITVGTARGHTGMLVVGYSTETSIAFGTGRLQNAIAGNESLLTHYRREEHARLASIGNHDPLCWAQSWISIAYWMLGRYREALAESQAQLRAAREIGHPWNLVWSLTGGSNVVAYLGELSVAMAGIAEAKAICRELHLDFAEQCICSFHEGLMRIGAGDFARGAQTMEQGARLWAAAGGNYNQTAAYTCLANAYVALGRLDAAEESIAQAEGVMAKTGERFWEAEIHRMRGEIARATGRPDAEADFQQALSVARGVGARTFELRTAISLARLWQRQGRHQEANDLLAPIYNWFTEGFDTKDLIEAKALLEELAR